MQYLGDTFRRRILRSRFRQCDGHRNDEADDDRYDSGCKCSDQVENDDGFQEYRFFPFFARHREPMTRKKMSTGATAAER